MEQLPAGNINKRAAAITVFVVVALALGVASFLSADRAPTKKDQETTVEAGAAAAREACKQFIEKRGYAVNDWGESWKWTTVKHTDGDWSVGARFIGMPPGRGTTNIYLSCVASQNGDQWTLVSLTPM